MADNRHTRILERISQLTDDAISKIAINPEGGIVCINNGPDFIISSSRKSGRSSEITTPFNRPFYTPLEKVDGGFRVLIGTFNGAPASLGGAVIYGSKSSAPKITSTDCDVYLHASITPISFFDATALIYQPSDMILSGLVVEEGAIGYDPGEIMATLDRVGGSVTQGEYYFFIGRIKDGEYVPQAELSPLPAHFVLPFSYENGDDFGVRIFDTGPVDFIPFLQTYPEITYLP